jgi:hypothetical protein
MRPQVAMQPRSTRPLTFSKLIRVGVVVVPNKCGTPIFPIGLFG